MATQIILFSTPFFFLLIFAELYADRRAKTERYRINDSITSLSLGVLSQTKKLVIFSLATIVYGWSADKLSIYQWPKDSIATWIFSFIFYDFLYYWYHRFSHQINFLWASHVVHHQSEEYNLTTALRQTSSSVMVWLFYIPSFAIGIPAEVFFVSGALNLVYQFWVHTQFIGKLGWYESIFVTPSHHRVHHGQNQIYIDRNHGGVFILWDKLFGTYQEELDSEPVIYGVRRPVHSFNPVWANLHTWYSLLLDAIHTKSWRDKFRIWFMPTGWRPSDVEIDYPMPKKDPTKQIKYSPESSKVSRLYVLLLYFFSVIFGVIFIQFGRFLALDIQSLFWILISLPLVTGGLFLEGRKNAVYWETLRLFCSATILYLFKDSLSETLIILIVIYLLSVLLFTFMRLVNFRKTMST